MLRKIQNYKKKTNRQSVNVITIEKLLKYKRPLCICLGAFLLVTLSTTLFSIGINKITNDDDIEFALTQSSQAAVSSKRDVIQIPVGMVKKNPFVPYGNVNNSKVHDVPDFALIDPPEIVDEGSDGARVMDTIVSGILYDKFSPVVNIMLYTLSCREFRYEREIPFEIFVAFVNEEDIAFISSLLNLLTISFSSCFSDDII